MADFSQGGGIAQQFIQAEPASRVGLILVLSNRLISLGAFLGGIVLSFLLIAVIVGATYRCQSGPCDAGSMIVFGFVVLVGPIFGLGLSYMTYRLLVRRERREQLG